MGDFHSQLATIELGTAYVVTKSAQVPLTEIATARLQGNAQLPPAVVISLQDPVDMLRALVALDGAVENIALISAGTSDKEIARRMNSTGEYLLVSDQAGRPDAITCDQLFSRFAGKRLVGKTVWQLSTSGTTSLPKQVAHSFASLTRSTKVGGGSAYVWGQLYDPYRFAGLQVLLQAVLGGSKIAFPDPKNELSDQMSFFQHQNVNALSATPTLWRKLLMTEHAHQLPLRSITLGGEIADERILNAVQRAYPNAKVRHIYASTEAGTGFSVTDGRAGFPKSFLDQPLGGLKLKIENDTLMILNPLASRGYIGEDSDFVDEQGFVNSGDSVRVEGDRVVFLGRSNGVINVGGNKVYPEHVENILLEVAGIKMVRVLGVQNSIVGALVVAEVVPDSFDNENEIRQSLKQLATEKLLKHERPVKLKFVSGIDHTDNGKVNRR